MEQLILLASNDPKTNIELTLQTLQQKNIGFSGTSINNLPQNWEDNLNIIVQIIKTRLVDGTFFN